MLKDADHPRWQDEEIETYVAERMADSNGLRKPADVDAHEAQNTDYYTADRARHDAASILGPRYAEVVRKCIQCDFGPVDDLEKAKLQEASHQDVIYELEELEERFRRFAVAI
ncbi:uncharacterized protein Z520_12079 [Fonsecaea multimorphosa CBS 102226]|uniref:Uncharacterized protein n=1 Tax=Fonsecaea multimorphosa CBS 102226 TaxID=1442371 RepID=A0A0D2K778_9EURO|nr:uncharacterized protein Z520_12079 [Fonsecaea multimorphosa CBS 102226]KIX92198.1 hypothetical protein Z520_12079 [Fonsecaea multimorphosa CBS 102226]